MKSLKQQLEPYVQQAIGVNAEKPFHIDRVTLLGVHQDHFSIRQQSNGLTRHIPYHCILQILQKDGGVEVGGLFTHRERFDLVVKITHLHQPLAG